MARAIIRRNAPDETVVAVGDEWISTREAATLLGVSESTVYRSLIDAAVANEQWGRGNWKTQPLAKRRIFRIKRSRVEEIKTASEPEPSET